MPGPFLLSVILESRLISKRRGGGYRSLRKPTDNAFIEAFNGKFRQECLNENWFLSLEAAEEKVESWRSHYNWGKAPQRSGKPAPEGVRRTGGNS